MSNEEVCYLSAAEAIRLFKRRELSPVGLLEALIARAEQVEPIINAFADTYYEDALRMARKAEERYGKRNGRIRPLEGIPMAVKDEMELKGRRTTQGSLILKDYVDTTTNPSIERLLRAGAIVHARSTCPEFSCAWVTYSRLHGVTVTPWNVDYTCGGSSGGSGASLAAGTTTLATGSDIAGSIRVPAAACGVVGFKPPFGRNPDSIPFNLDMYNVIGPMARTVGDCALMQNVTAGPHPRDIATIRPKLRIPSELKGIEGWRIAYSLDLDYFTVSNEVRENTLRAVEALRDQGAAVEEVTLGWTEKIKKASIDYLNHLFGEYLAQYYDKHRELLTDYTVYNAKMARGTTAADILESLEVAGRAYEALGPVLDKFHALVCPTTVVPGIPATMGPWETFTVNGRTIDADFDWVMTYPFNMLSRLPVLAVPSGFGSNGVPTGIQIVARAFDDARVFRVGAALERAMPWLDTVARRPSL